MLMTPVMLEEYLAGAMLARRRPSQRSLWQWARTAERLPDSQARDHARTLMHIVADLPVPQQLCAITDVLGALDVQFAKQGQTAPMWLGQLIGALEREI